MDFIKPRDSTDSGTDRLVPSATVDLQDGDESLQHKPDAAVPASRLAPIGSRPIVTGHALRRSLYPVRRSSADRTAGRSRRRRRLGPLN